MGLERINEDLEGYRDNAMGTIVFNKTMVPKTSCDEFRSVAEITNGAVYRSKSGEFSIYKYVRDGESVAVTLNQQQRSCGRKLYQTGIPNIHVLVLEGKEDFLNNKHLRVEEMEEEIMLESEIRGAMNSIELSWDNMYKDINFRACEMARQDIVTSQALMKANLDIIRDRKGRTLLPHIQGEAVTLYRCKPTEVRIRHDVTQCCKELPIWYGRSFSIPAFMQPISKKSPRYVLLEFVTVSKPRSLT